MYAMTLQQTGPDRRVLLPGLTLVLERSLITNNGLDVVVADLLVRLQALGWGRARDENARAATEPLADVHIGPRGTWVYASNLPDVNGGVIMADSGPPPASPADWWSWVKRFEYRCAVTLVAGDIDLAGPNVVAELDRCAQQGSVLMASACVVQDGPADFTTGPSGTTGLG